MPVCISVNPGRHDYMAKTEQTTCGSTAIRSSATCCMCGMSILIRAPVRTLPYISINSRKKPIRIHTYGTASGGNRGIPRCELYPLLATTAETHENINAAIESSYVSSHRISSNMCMYSSAKHCLIASTLHPAIFGYFTKRT